MKITPKHLLAAQPLAAKYRKWLLEEFPDSQRATTGHVIVYRGTAVGWKKELIEPETQVPGCIAVAVDESLHVSVGGNDQDGAKGWSPVPTPHPDGFNGAGDAAILRDYSEVIPEVPGVIMVQAVKRTRDLLRRAGFKRVKTHEFYPVKFRVDEQNRRLQLA